jgi:hypothetical protein
MSGWPSTQVLVNAYRYIGQREKGVSTLKFPGTLIYACPRNGFTPTHMIDLPGMVP